MLNTINKYYCRGYTKGRRQHDIRRKYIHSTSMSGAKKKYKTLYRQYPQEIVKVPIKGKI